MTVVTWYSWVTARPVSTVAKPQIPARDTSGTRSNATIFRRMDVPRKRMASPSSSPSPGYTRASTNGASLLPSQR
jgi:hypothetical protein